MDNLEPNQVQLSDGRIATMRETNGRDENAAAQMLGKHFTQDAAGISLYTKALVMRGIEDIDGKPIVTGPIKFADFNRFWADIKTRDSQRLTKKYHEMNGDSEDPLDEKDESEDSPTSLDSEK